MSVTALAELLDRLLQERRAFLKEADDTVTPSGLSLDVVHEILRLCYALGWRAQVFDSAGSVWTEEQLSEDLSPFRVVFKKPPAPDGCLQILTNHGFRERLGSDEVASVWHVARLTKPLKTQKYLFTPWGVGTEYQPSETSKNPRLLVKEYGEQRLVPPDIRSWMLQDAQSDLDVNDPAARTWANEAIQTLSRCLANEIDGTDHSLLFKGPPRLRLRTTDLELEPIDDLGLNGFSLLQTAAHWVFDNEREAEMRHVLLATELARSGNGGAEPIAYIREHLGAALDGAKIAYQMGLAEMSRDTLKSLADLRKAIADETSKLADSTRQLGTSVTGAMAVGFTLIAARFTNSAHPYLIAAIMIVVVIYVGLVIYWGQQFISLQRELRREWQPKLYRFLAPDEYRKMVDRPAAKAEKTYYRTSAVGAVAVLLLAGAVIYAAFCLSPDQPLSKPTSTSVQSSAPQRP
ncbi:hypothetical protein M2322_003169 [Rhodoblastus acidophilus]|uniref:hypothetical protein n=1 Tax=Rhodoblastus acidophilus TaxID=1074 RepID=UPI002225642E|nr:hypothetical protein [Rhodoblastus acidophilus]MCW2317605.1 hypothetical protein [Rhodoblastus acidophilus]